MLHGIPNVSVAATIPFILLGFTTLLVEIYVRIPQNLIYGSYPPFLQENLIDTNNNRIDKIFLLFHGAGGIDSNTN